ncbi:PaaI family thioesterase [Erysipelothrix sp. HDW6C]|uniref:PaaI family thioesterase n=1 Tax=Erysipelothrix sp. HDW6C TaxID=2714930 RepID=UPI0014097A0E|nr:PaaI family thioesterase [Erysipelothrix sp. HDW6C]QIK70050.1 PaaI family thioesterase [Erysipelothrix sp. HDW6C]
METNNSFMQHNGIEIVDVYEDYASTRVNFSNELTNYYGFFHGGVYFTLADSAAGLASRSNGANYVTLNANINFMKAVKSGYIYSKARVMSRTTKICVVNVDIFDDHDQLVNSGTYTMYRIK